ncbi:MAG: hypothetical protein M3251_04990 [Thermoproteota archaeon]|nr:hypothetical protein [Thermoproteota archaeon]MDQ3888612.1 hypothetical protein [Thermoproteota archaeon]
MIKGDIYTKPVWITENISIKRPQNRAQTSKSGGSRYAGDVFREYLY